MRIFLLFVNVIFPILTLSAQYWPDKPERILTLFGHPTTGYFGRGLEFDAVGQRVTAWNDGEVIWADVPLTHASVTGERLIVLEHEDGFRTFYRRLENHPELEQTISQGDWIGYADDDTWLFQITDSMRSRIVNPALLLPAWNNENVNSEFKAYLVRGDEFLELKDGLSLSPGILSLALEGVIPMEISLYWVGKGVVSVRFETLAEKDGSIVMETPHPVFYGEIYDENNRFFLRNIPLSAGLGILELRMRTENNHTYSRLWNLAIRDK